MNEEKKPYEFLPITAQTVEKDTQERVSTIAAEFRHAFDFIKKFQKSVTFFGSARFTEDNPHYQAARALAGRIVRELGCTIITGGGPGIMEAANRGAIDERGVSVGLNIKLSTEQRENPFLTDFMEFHYFFSRKVALSFAAEAYVYFPGGAGTLDEFFEIFTLIQTNKIQGKVPMILVGEDYWRPFDSFIRNTLLEKHHTINTDATELYTITEDSEQILNIIKNAPIRE